MEEMLRYIFGNLESFEKMALGLQEKTNNLVTVFAVTVTIYMVTSEIRRAKQANQIEKLHKELEKLKRAEGA